MEKEINIPEVENENIFNDEIAAQIKEMEQSLEATESVVEEVKNPEELSSNIKEENHIVPNVDTIESTPIQEEKSSNFDSLFSSLSNDVAGANNFISTLIEQQKKVNLNEASLNEEKQKLENDKNEFEKYCDAQREILRQEKERLDEYERTQKIRLQNDEKEFNSEVESTKNELALADKGVQIARLTLEEERMQFEKYKQLEEQKIQAEKERLEEKKSEFNKQLEIENSKIDLEKEKINTERKSFENEKNREYSSIEQAKQELEAAKSKFEDYKQNEQSKLEQESKNLSQSCARFKELVSQFNSGFGQLPGNE